MIEKIVADNEQHIAMTNQAVLANTKKKFLIIVTGFGFVMVFSLVLAFAVARSITRPVFELRLGADEFRQGKLGISIPTGGNDELSLLARMFNSMAENLNKTTVSRDLLVKEISERKKTEKALKKSEDTLKSIFRAAPIGIGLVSERVLLWVNERLCSMLGRTRDELEGQSARVLYPSQEEFEWVVQEKYDQIRKHGTGTVETRWQRKHGGIIDVLLSSAPLDTSDLTVGVTFTALDITDRKRAEEALATTKGMLEAAIAHSPSGILVADAPDVTIRLSNPAALGIRGGDPKTLTGIKVEQHSTNWQTFRPDGTPYPPEQLPLSRAVLSGEETYDEEVIIRDEKAEDRWVSANASPIRDGQGHIVSGIVVFHDITERKRAEEALRKSEEKLARSKKMESVGLLAGGVAHDLNNILSGIVSYPELLLLDLPEDSKLRKPIKTIQESGHRAAAIVQDLLTVARGVATTKEPLNLNAIVEGYLLSPEFLKLEQFHPTVKVKTNLDTDLLSISASDAHLRKVVMNLVSNAAEAIEGIGNAIISTMNRYVDRSIRGYDDVNVGEYAVLSVSDDGPGIPTNDLERIFEPFYTKKVMGRSGTGLGLAVVWNTLQDHKGYIDVISDENGTTFELYFPITREEISGKDLSIPIEDYKGEGETILVVDDVESQRVITCEMLDKLGYKAKAVPSGEEAVEYLKEHTVDFILLDMIMDPGINGRETYERIIKIHPNQKAIIVSGFAETDDVKEAQRLGAGQYIKKPLTLEKMGIAVRDELKKWQKEYHSEIKALGSP